MLRIGGLSSSRAFYELNASKYIHNVFPVYAQRKAALSCLTEVLRPPAWLGQRVLVTCSRSINIWPIRITAVLNSVLISGTRPDEACNTHHTYPLDGDRCLTRRSILCLFNLPSACVHKLFIRDHT